MRSLILPSVLLVLLVSANSCAAQYTVVKESEGLVFSIKWASQKWYKPKGPKVLLVKVENKNEWSANYTLGVDVSRNGIMLESSEESNRCMKGKSVAKGRFNGIVYPMVSISQEDIKTGNFDLELTGLEIEKTDKCPEKSE